MINVLVTVVFMKIQTINVNLVIKAVKHVLELKRINVCHVTLNRQDYMSKIKMETNIVSVTKVIMKKNKYA